MDIEYTNDKELDEELSSLEGTVEKVDSESELRNYIVNYVGNKVNPEDDQVTVKMIVETVAEEFPDFLLAVAEENWIRGYQQAIHDVDEGKRLIEKTKEEQEGSE
jgi:hypothetical protein